VLQVHGLERGEELGRERVAGRLEPPQLAQRVRVPVCRRRGAGILGIALAFP